MAALESKFVGSLSGCVALVTGASRGIGKGIAQMICEAGATVYITGMNHYIFRILFKILPSTYHVVIIDVLFVCH